MIPSEPTDSSDPAFWELRYDSGRVPWDLQGAPHALDDYLRRTAPGRTVLIPGCGFGHEVRSFHQAGWTPIAIDFSAAAVTRAKAGLGPLASCVRQADFFGPEIAGPFDLVYERTFLCALPVQRWPAYARRMHDLLRPEGVLAGIFYHGIDPDGPPFPIDAGTAAALFTGFELIADRPIPSHQSLPLHAGFERWQEWRRSR